MSNKSKNIVTNILGLVFYGLSVYSFFLDKDIKYIVSLLVIGSVLFLFKNDALINLLNRILNKKKENIDFPTVDPDKEPPNGKG